MCKWRIAELSHAIHVRHSRYFSSRSMQLNPVRLDARTIARYAELGVDQLVVYPLPLEDPADVARFLEYHATLFDG
jgi:hypothetical protein